MRAPVEAIKPDLDGKRLIFTSTTGRSGTRFLAEMLRLVPGVASYHEPQPRFSDLMRAVQQDTGLASEFWVHQKLPCIAAEPQPIYVETSHVFCKGFLEPLLALSITPDLIVLTRPHRQVAASIYQLDRTPVRTEKGRYWYLSPEDPGVLPLPGWQKLHDYQLCYWYCLEIERRSREYERTLQGKGARVADVTLDEVGSLRGFSRLVRRLSLPPMGVMDWLGYLKYRNRRVNTKAEKKRPLGLSERELDALEGEVEEVVGQAG